MRWKETQRPGSSGRFEPQTGYPKTSYLSHLFFMWAQACHFSLPTHLLIYQMGHTGWFLLALIFWCSSVSQIANICLKHICTSLIKLNRGESITFRQLTDLPFLGTAQ